jgi:PIN domain nuclease of toxin-antitoxin system
MKLLLDTHIFLGYISGDPQLPVNHREAIQDPSNSVFLSAASVWEAVIKNSLGNLPLPESPSTYLPKQRQAHGISSLPIEEPIFEHLSVLPQLHRDLFDRILISQALFHGLTLASVDRLVRAYAVPLLPVG